MLAKQGRVSAGKSRSPAPRPRRRRRPGRRPRRAARPERLHFRGDEERNAAGPPEGAGVDVEAEQRPARPRRQHRSGVVNHEARSELGALSLNVHEDGGSSPGSGHRVRHELSDEDG